MVKGRRNSDDKIKNIEDEVDRLIRRREKSKETMPEVLYVPEGKKREEEYIKPEFVPKPKTKKKRIFRKTDFLRTRIAKPVAIILVISMILTGIQLVSLISTGETVIVPSYFGIPEEFENAKQEFENQSTEVKENAEGLLNDASWSVEELPERDIIYDKSLISKEKPEWPCIFGDIEDADITPEASYKSWTHTINADFNSNCSDSMNVVIDDDMIKLQTLGVGMFTSNPLDSGTDNAVLKDVTWHESTPIASQIVIIVEVSQTAEDGTWIPVWKSVDVLPDWFPDIGEFATEVVSGRYFRYLVGFSGALAKPQLEDIIIQVATATVDRKYYTFTYYNDNLEVDKDGVAGGNVTQLGFTIPEYNYIDVDPSDGDTDDIVVSLRLKGRLSDNETLIPPTLLQPPTYLIGGLEIEIYKINKTKEIDNLTIYFVKPISYDNKTYIWIIGFYFSSMPEHFYFNAISENIVLEAAAFAMGGETPVSVQPPYEITWSMSSQIHEFAFSVGYAKFGPVNASHHFEARFSPGISSGYIYYEEIAEKLSLNWRGSDETDVSACYREENLYIEFEIDNMPSSVDLLIESGEPLSTLNYEASSVLSSFSYTSYDFVSGSITHVSISNIPLHINIIGTFKIPPKEEPNPDPSDSFIGRVLNYVIARIGATMNRIRKALTSITEIVSTPDNIFHLSIPDGIISKIEFWSLKGEVENNVIYCELLNLSGNYVGMLNSSIQAGLKNVTELNLSFGRNITLMLKSSGGEDFKALGLIQDMKGLISIPEMPDTVSIKGTQEEINYSFSAPVELNILAKTQNYNMDAAIKNITSGVFTKKDQNISLEFDQPVELECAAGKGSLYKMTNNYFFTNTSEKTASLRIGNLKSLHLGEQTGLILSEEYSMKIMLETNVTSGKILIKNLPGSFNASLPMPLITLPEMENMHPTMDLFSSFATSLEQATLNLDRTVREGLVNGTLAFSYDSAMPPVLVVNLSTGENTLPWQHGITLKKSDLTLDMKAYLELPEKASFVFDRRNGLELGYQFENWNPTFNWVSADLEIENKNIFALINITDAVAGEGSIKLTEEKTAEPVEEEEKPSKIENLSAELFLASIPQKLNLNITRGSNTSLSWSASNSIESIYLNIIRENEGIFYPSYLMLRDAPVKADFTITSASKATLFQVPEISVNAPDKLDFNLKLDAGLVGGRGDFLLYAEELECFSLKAHDNTVTINSMVDKLLFRLSNVSLGGMKEIEILSLDLKSLTFTANFVFGKFPILEINCDAKETQINLIPSVSTPFGEKNSVALTDFSFLSLNIRKNSVRITDTRTHYITVAPILSLWW